MSSSTVAAMLAAATLTTTLFPLLTAAAAARVGGPLPVVIGRPGCETRCGNVSVPFPFGFGPARCSATGLNLTCDNTTRPGRPRLLLGAFQVMEISIERSMVRVAAPPIIVSRDRNLSSSSSSSSSSVVAAMTTWGWVDENSRSQYNLFPGSNDGQESPQLVVMGCNVEATLHTTVLGSNNFVMGCSSYCDDDDDHPRFTPNDTRNYNGMCYTPINNLETSYQVQVRRLQGSNGSTINDDDLPVSVFIVDGETLNTVPDWAIRLVNPNRGRPKQDDGDDLPLAPVKLMWTCSPDGSYKVSASDKMICQMLPPGFESLEWPGLYSYCRCQEGFQGNPYLTSGCQDIDECKDKRKYGCFGECRNNNGSFDCWCPRGYHGNATQPKGCIKYEKNAGLSVVIGVSCGVGFILLVLAAFFISKILKRRRTQMLRRKFFQQNHGQLLEQLVSQNAGIAERMIITLDELEKATHNFDKDLVVGSGGQGTVYKGILSNQHIVAIKKPMKMDQKDIDAFINEVAILSQINHRNVVKLYGCCLETEVPMLIYEFISNGKLSEHLHVEGPKSLSWDNRFRIATEAAKSIAYLHSTASIPIIHRDIKSANILLDDTLTTKVADFGASRNIPIEKSGLTTMVQGTRGYWDPACFYTGRLTEKSDVFSFGIVLMELLTRKKPYSYLSSDDEALIVHFSTLFAQGNLFQILDPQVVEEGAKEVGEVATLAVACMKFTPEDRPTMRQVELTLEGIRSPKAETSDNIVAENVCEIDIAIDVLSDVDRSDERSTRRYSMEEEFALSARYPR